jgi:antitoxin component YwqK of YwqJK toxin-antitoxin module
MKQLLLIGLFLITLNSCSEHNSDKPFSVDINTNDGGQVSDVKIIRNEIDSNYIQLTFYPDGEIEMLREFKNGQENGKNFRWRENGQLALDGFKVDGEYDRVTREVRDDGRTGFEGKRTNTKFEGINNSFYKSGAIERSWNRVNSKDFGRSIYYHENGMIKEVGDYTDSGYVLKGKWNENGDKIE